MHVNAKVAKSHIFHNSSSFTIFKQTIRGYKMKLPQNHSFNLKDLVFFEKTGYSNIEDINSVA